MKNVSIKAIQNGLKELGYLTRTVRSDGAWGGATVAGYAEYVRNHGGKPYQEGQPKVLAEIPGPLRDMFEADPETPVGTEVEASQSLPAGDTANFESMPATGGEPSKPAPSGEQIAAGDTVPVVPTTAPATAPAPAKAPVAPKAPAPVAPKAPDGGSESA